MKQSWFPEDETLPLMWVGVAGLVAVTSLAAMVWCRPSAGDRVPEVDSVGG